MMAPLAFAPFVEWIYIGWWWYLLLAPLSLGIAIVYKTLKVRNVRQVPMAAQGLTATIVAGMALAAAALYLIYFTVTALRS